MSGGYIPEYLHCLFNIVGGISFAAKSEASIIKITMDPAAQYLKYQGPQDSIDFSKFDNDIDVIHTVYNNSSFFQWQEVLLTKRAIIPGYYPFQKTGS